MISSYQSKVGANGFVKDSNVYAFDPADDEEPRVRTYNLAIDQRIPGNMLLEIAYVGNHSDKLMNDGSTQNTTLDNLNSLPIGTLFGPQPSTRPDLAGSDACYVPGSLHPEFGPASGTNCSAGSISQGVIDSYKPFPLYDHLFVPEHNAYSNYNGLQVALVRQVGHAHFNVNYTWSKALDILGIGGSSTYSYPGDPFNYHNDYSNMTFDRRSIFNASYSYEVGRLVHQRFVGGFTNNWLLSGISTYQSAPNLTSIISPDFSLGGSITVPVGAVATVGNNTSTCKTTSGTGTCSVPVSNTDILGTPDVDLQPTVVGMVNAVDKGKHQYVNASALSLPALGTNGPYRYGFLPGPGFFDTDLTAAKTFKVTEGSSIQLRVAAFNFINHANNSFTSVNLNNYTLNFSQNVTTSNVNQALLGTNASSDTQFGYAPLKEGRRIMELGLRYDF